MTDRPTAAERMIKMETQITDIQEKLGLVGTNIDKLNDKLDALDKRYASKWVETTVVGIVATIVSGLVIFAILNFPKVS